MWHYRYEASSIVSCLGFCTFSRFISWKGCVDFSFLIKICFPTRDASSEIQPWRVCTENSSLRRCARTAEILRRAPRLQIDVSLQSRLQWQFTAASVICHLAVKMQFSECLPLIRDIFQGDLARSKKP